MASDDVTRRDHAAGRHSDSAVLDAALMAELRAIDDAQAPQPAFAEQLWEDLMDDAARRASGAEASSTLASVPNGRTFAAALEEPTRQITASRRWWPGTEIAAVAAVVLMLLTGFAAYLLIPPDARDPDPNGASSLAVNPDGTPSVLGPDDCRVAPRSPESLVSLIEPLAATVTPPPTWAPPPPGGGSSVGWIVPLMSFPAWEPADSTIVAEVTAALEDLVACAGVGDGLRFYALLSDDFFRDQVVLNAEMGIPVQSWLDHFATPPAPPTEEQPELVTNAPEVQNIIMLPDGRVGAIVVFDAPGAFWGPEEPTGIIFVRSGDRWLVDELGVVRGVRPTPVATSTPPAAEAATTTTAVLDDTTSVPGPNECHVEARSMESLVVLVGTPGTVDGGDRAESGSDTMQQPVSLPPGPAVDEETLAAINATLRELSACGIEGDDLRVLALFSDAYVYRLVGEFGSEQELMGALESPASVVWVLRMQPELLYFVRNAQTLPDGRVGAILHGRVAAFTWDPDPAFAVILVQHEGRWLIDELGPLAGAMPATEGDILGTAPAFSLDPNSVELTIEVDLDRLLAGDQEATDQAIQELDRVLAPYRSECRVGFALTSAHADDIGSGVQLARTINHLLVDEFPDLFSGAAFEQVAVPGVEPRGQVRLQLFFFAGCPTPAGGG